MGGFVFNSGGHNTQFNTINFREKPGLNLKSCD